MRDKDIALRELEHHNDVYAEIVRVLALKNRLQTDLSELLDMKATTGYRSGKRELRDQTRDCVKLWIKQDTPIAIIGIENQSDIDAFMPIRVYNYDSVDEKIGMIHYLEAQKTNQPCIKPVPAMTIVLYFGIKQKWRKPLTLSDCIDIPRELSPYIANHRILVVNLAWISPKTIKKLKSDIRIVVEMLRQLRLKKEFKLKPGDIVKHPYDLAMVLYAFTKDQRFLDYFNPKMNETEMDMCEFLDKIENKGKKEGVKETGIIWKYLKSIGAESKFDKIFENRRFYLKMLRQAKAALAVDP